MNIEVLKHASIRLTGQKTIYFDPYQIETSYNDATYIFITHDHYDHYEEASIKKVISETTTIIVPTCLKERAQKITNNLLVVEPNTTYTLDNLIIDVVPAYNTESSFHPKEKKYVGYNITMNGTTYYIMGDTNRTIESNQVQADICFVPIGGTYTMDVKEATEYINYLKPQKAIPIHYGSIVGDKSLAQDFKRLIDKEIEVEILI